MRLSHDQIQSQNTVVLCLYYSDHSLIECSVTFEDASSNAKQQIKSVSHRSNVVFSVCVSVFCCNVVSHTMSNVQSTDFGRSMVSMNRNVIESSKRSIGQCNDEPTIETSAKRARHDDSQSVPQLIQHSQRHLDFRQIVEHPPMQQQSNAPFVQSPYDQNSLQQNILTHVRTFGIAENLSVIQCQQMLDQQQHLIRLQSGEFMRAENSVYTNRYEAIPQDNEREQQTFRHVRYVNIENMMLGA